MPIPWKKRKERVKLWEDNNKKLGRMPYWNDRARWLNTRVKKIYSLSETISGEELKELYEMSTKQCFYCGEPIVPSQVHFDHMESLAAGGRHEKTNLCVSCQACNIKKGSDTTDDFLAMVFETGQPERVYRHLYT